MSVITVAKLEQIRPGEPFTVRAAGLDLVLCHVEGQIFALDGVCPHVGGPLAHGTLHGRMLTCPWHGWEFDCATGEMDRNPACRLTTYPVTLRDGQVQLELPDA